MAGSNLMPLRMIAALLVGVTAEAATRRSN